MDGPHPMRHFALRWQVWRTASKSSSFAFDREKIADNLNRLGFGKCQFLESRKTQDGEGLHCFLAVHEDSQKQNELAVLRRKVEFNPICLTIGLDRFRAGTDYLEKYRWLLGKVPVRELADHAPINYVWAIAANQS
jgi:hypothetical protein